MSSAPKRTARRGPDSGGSGGSRESTSFSDRAPRTPPGIAGRVGAVDDDAIGRAVHHDAGAARDNQGDDGRGRAAETPSQIPPAGWKDIFWRIYRNIPEHRILAIAAGVTFYALLAIFPGIAALVALYGLFADPSTIGQHLAELSSVLPSGAIDVIGDQLKRLTEQGNARLGFAFLLGLAISVWSANAGVKALFDALNIVYGEREKRSFLKLNAISLAFTCAALLFILLALAALVVLPLITDLLGLVEGAQQLIALGKWPALLLAIGVMIAIIYRYGPSREAAQWRWLTWGSAFAAIGWLAVSVIFSWYAAHFGSYNKTYGSVGAVIGLMTWMWLSSIVILLGAELDAEMEHQTARDTTTGPAAPLGARGAQAADTVGKPSE
jgi:membrane protein